MANLKIYHDPKKVKKNGEASIFITVNIQYKKLFFYTGVSCLPDKFDPDTLRIRGTSKKVKDDNLIIEKCLATMNDIFVRYRLQNIEITPDLLKREWKNPARRIDFYAFFNEVIKERKDDIEQSTIAQHKSSIEKLKEYKKTLTFSEIDHDFIDGYRKWLKTKKKNDINTIYSALKNFRTYVSIAKRKGIIKESPFSTYSLKRVDTDRIFLTEKEVQDLWIRYNKRWHNDNNQRVLRHFLFMCFTGLRISDLKSVTKDCIVHDTLVFVPIKTKNVKVKPIKFPLNSYAKKLIEDESSLTNLLFNCLSEQKMRSKIKDIVKVDGIYKDVSLHTGRHTFATIWLNKTKDVVALQRLLGHSDINQTMIYVHMTDNMVQKEMLKFDSTLFTKTKIPDAFPEPGIN
jgi:site-specific recombinase XerD